MAAANSAPRRPSCAGRWRCPEQRRADQNADAERNAHGEQRPLFGFAGDAGQRIAAVFGAEIERLIAKAPGLIARRLTAFAETVPHLAQDCGDGVADLIARGSRSRGGLAPGHAADPLQFLLDSAEMLLDGGNAGSEIRCAVLEHAASRNQ